MKKMVKNGPNPGFQGLQRAPSQTWRPGEPLNTPKTHQKPLLHTYKHVVGAQARVKCPKMTITGPKKGLKIIKNIRKWSKMTKIRAFRASGGLLTENF